MKFFVKDDEGREFDVEEITTEEVLLEEKPLDNESSLSEIEIEALKKLASVADKLVALVAEKVDDEEPDDEVEEVEEAEEVEEDADEKVIDTKARDSRKSFGAIEKKRVALDSLDDIQLEIADCWNKRFNGGNK